MRALNSVPGVQIAGENGNILDELLALDRKLQVQASHAPIYSWHNSFLPSYAQWLVFLIDQALYGDLLYMTSCRQLYFYKCSQIRCDLRKFIVDVINPQNQVSTIGFKEIRINRREQLDFVR